MEWKVRKCCDIDDSLHVILIYVPLSAIREVWIRIYPTIQNMIQATTNKKWLTDNGNAAELAARTQSWRFLRIPDHLGIVICNYGCRDNIGSISQGR